MSESFTASGQPKSRYAALSPRKSPDPAARAARHALAVTPEPNGPAAEGGAGDADGHWPVTFQSCI